MGFAWIPEQRAIIFLKNVNWLVLIIETNFVSARYELEV